MTDQLLVRMLEASEVVQANNFVAIVVFETWKNKPCQLHVSILHEHFAGCYMVDLAIYVT